MKLIRKNNRKIEFLIVLVIFVLGMCMKTNKIEAATGTYSEVIDEISWTVTVDTYGVVAVRPTDKLQMMDDVTIPSTVAGYTVNKIAESAFSRCNSLTNITIPASVTSIGDLAFYNCSKLEVLEIPSSVTSLGTDITNYCSKLCSVDVNQGNSTYCSVDGVVFTKNMKAIVLCPEGRTGTYTVPSEVEEISAYAFSGCSSIDTIILPSTVTKIGKCAFNECSSITNISIPSRVTVIEDSTFENCSNLTNITIPRGITEIGSSAFSGCKSINTITLPSTVTKIGEYAFSECSNLTSISLPSGVTAIEGWTFAWCTSLDNITIPEGVVSIGEYAFFNCSNLMNLEIPSSVTSLGKGVTHWSSNLLSVNVDEDNSTYCSIDGVVFTKNMKTIVLCPAGNWGTFTVPDGVEVIGAYAFSGCLGIDTISLPSTVTEIEEYAFCWCSSIGMITLSNTITKIGEYAFSECSNLTSISIPSGVTEIEASTFEFCSSLKSIIISSGITEIGDASFWGCTDLTSIYYYGMKGEFANISIAENNSNFKEAKCYCMKITIEKQPVSAKYNIFSSVTPLSVVSSNGTDKNGTLAGTLSYQWYSNRNNSNVGGTAIADATESSYSPEVIENGTTYYYCVVTNTCDSVTYSVTSETAEIVVGNILSKVTFDSNGGTIVEEQEVPYGTCVEEPDEPTMAGHNFIGWYIDEELTSLYDFTSTVTESIVLYAGWEMFDYSELERAVIKAKNYLANEEFVVLYTNSSLMQYQAVVTQAQTMLDEKNAVTMNDIEEQIIALINARKSLLMKANIFPSVVIEDGIASVRFQGEFIVIHKFVKGNARTYDKFNTIYEQEGVIKGSPESTEVALTESGIYTFYATDKFENEFYVSKYYNASAGSTGSGLDYSDLYYEITKALELYESVLDSSVGLGIKQNYATPESKLELSNAINDARNAAAIADTQEIIDSALQELQNAEQAFRNSLLTVTRKLATVNGSTITVQTQEGCAITRVRYNADENGVLVDGIWKSYTGSNYEENRKAKFKDFVWENVPDGVYTFEIRELDAFGNEEIVFEVVTVATENEPAVLAQAFLNRLIGMAQSSMDGIKKKSEAQVGDTYVPDARYNKLLSTITESLDTVDSETVDFDSVVNQCYTLFDIMCSFAKYTYVMEEADVLTVTETQGVITITKQELRQIYYARGTYDNLDDIQNAGGQICWPSNNTGTFSVDYNDTYTLFLTFADNTTELVTVNVSDIPSPFSITESNGVIHIENSGYDIKKMGYCYGDNQDITSSDYIIFDSMQSEFSIVGNGVITIYLKDCNDEEYFETITVNSFTEPLIVVEGDTITPYTYGFDIEVVKLAQGYYTNWDEMSGVSIEITQNQSLNKSDFVAGEYTFYFQAKDGTEYIEYITME